MKKIPEAFHSSLARKLIARLLVFSFILTLIVTVIIDYTSYRILNNDLEENFNIIGNSITAIEAPVWSVNEEEIELQLHSFISRSFIEYAALKESGKTIVEAGRITTNNRMNRTYSIEHLDNGRKQFLGTLEISANLDLLEEKAYEQAETFLVIAAAVIFASTMFIIRMIHSNITTHLSFAADYLNKVKPSTYSEPLKFYRSNKSKDELDVLADSINSLQKNSMMLFNKLNESETQLRTILDNVDAYIYLKDTQGRYLFANKSVCNLWKVTLDEVVGHGDEKFFDEKTTINIHANDARVLVNGETLRTEETNNVPTTGRTATYQSTKLPIRADDGSIVALCGISVDLTDRIEAEQQIRKLAQVVEQSPESIVITDSNVCIEYVNEAYIRTSGYSREELIGKNPRILQSGHTPHEVFVDMWDCLSHAKPWRGKLFNRRKNGTYYTELASISPITQPDGHTSHYVGVNQDVTEKLATEAKLLEEYRLRMEIIKSIPGIFILLDEEGKMLLWNRKATEILGVSDEAYGKYSIGDFTDPIDRETVIHAFNSALNGFESTIEANTTSSSGQRISILYNTVPFKYEGRKSVLAYGTDISQLKEVESELERHRAHLEELVKTRTAELAQAKLTAESANSAKSDFLANMSHEIRGPLNAVMGMAHLIRRGGLNHQQKERMDNLDSASEHLLEILNSILDISKIEAGKLELNIDDVQISKVVENVISMIRDKADEKHLLLSTEIDLPVDLFLGDSIRLQQALFNYASNAIKFTKEGKIIFRVKAVQEKDNYMMIRFEVQDTGIGIPAHTIPRLFNVFEQSDNSITREYTGTGLGLSITKKIALLMGGNAGVESQAVIGSTFWFTARLKKSYKDILRLNKSTESTAEELLRSRHKGARILIVDDEIMNQTLFAEYLAIVGLEAVKASDGLSAIELVTGENFDLILMDLQMPKMDGLSASRKIRALNNGKTVPVLALTGNAFANQIEQYRSSGINDLIIKPIVPETLYKFLLKWLNVGKQI